MQLSHSGRQQDIGGVENQMRKALSSTSRSEPFMGFLCQAMTRDEIKQTIQYFADGARRAREAGLDGVELHSANGYLFTQFLSSAINDRKDEYGGPLENRARFLIEVIEAIRREVGHDFHLQFKISATEYANAVYFWERRGNTIEDSKKVCQWAEKAGADAVHVSTGASFPHPLNPPGGFPIEDAIRTYDTMLSSGTSTLFIYMSMRLRLLRPLFRWFWNHSKGTKIEGVSEDDAKAIREVVNIPVLVTGGFQTASYIRRIIHEGYCDGVSIARSLIANPDLPQIFKSGRDLPEKPCTYCNKCLVNALENPLGCYDVTRFDGDYDRMMREIMSVYQPSPFAQLAMPAAGAD
jgi:2,4-dienoyl-CoA reductase (NADPH2)